jgi:Na+/H+ antiporter NhaD/arsenite permease-like protein
MTALPFTLYGIVALIIFIIAYVLVVLEEVIDLRKSKPVVLGAGLIWLLVGLAFTQSGHGAEAEKAAAQVIEQYGELLLFLLVSITYVNVLEERRGFDVLQARLSGRGLSFRQLFWLIGFVSFVLSIVLANMTTALVMGAVALKLGRGNGKFITLTCINIVVASNAGGAFCPFGDVTSLMVWQAGKLDFYAFFKLFLPALIDWVIPALLMTLALPPGGPLAMHDKVVAKPGLPVVALLFGVSVFLTVYVRNALGLPPVIGMVIGLGLLQAYSYTLQRWAARNGNSDMVLDSFAAMQRVEWDTLLFFFGIMLGIGGLAQLGWLGLANTSLYQGLGATVANIAIGPVSAVLDNVPLVYAVLQMNPAMNEGQWLLLTLAAGVGGSLLAIGSAAGIALMGLAGKDYTFVRHLVWLPAIGLGYAAGIALHLVLNGGFTN